MKNTKKFIMAIMIAIGIGFLPAVIEMKNYLSQIQSVKMDPVPLMEKSELAQEFNKTILAFKNAEKPDDFFLAVIEQNKLENLIDKYESVNGAHERITDKETGDVLKRRVNGAMTFASENLREQYGIREMAAARSTYETQLSPQTWNAPTNTQVGYYALLGYLWSVWVMFCVFSFRMKNFMHFAYELFSGKLILASVAWIFFVGGYLKEESNDYRNVAAMAKFAAVNLSILLSAFLSAGIATAQSSSSKTKTSKRSTSLIFDQTAEADSGKNADATFVLTTKKDNNFQEYAAIVNRNGWSHIGLAGVKISGESKFDINLYGGYRVDLRKNAADSQRLFSGLRINRAFRVSKDHTLQLFVPFLQYEKYVKPKLKKAFFSTGQMYDKFKTKLRFGAEFTVRKEEGSKPFVSGGPFVGYNIFKNFRTEGTMLFSNSGPPRFKLRTVLSF